MGKALHPLGMFLWLHKSCEACKHLLAITDDGHIGLHVLVNLGMVNVNVYHLCLFCIGRELTCHAVAETHTHGNEQVALVGIHVRAIVSVHSQHTHAQWVVGGESRESHQGTCYRDTTFLNECHKFLVCLAKLNTLTNEHERTLGLVDEACCLGHGAA